MRSAVPTSPLYPLAFKLAFAPPDVDAGVDFLFVDDYAIVLKSFDKAQLRKTAQSVLDRFWKYSQDTNITFDGKKSCVLPITSDSRISHDFGPNRFHEVTSYKYLGFMFSTRAHDRSSGLCVDLQEQREREELTKRLGWLRLVAMSRSGACPEVSPTLYLSLIRSKIEFGILLKAESRYMKMLKEFQIEQ